MGSAFSSCLPRPRRHPAGAKVDCSATQQAVNQVHSMGQPADVDMLLARAQQELERSELLGSFKEVCCSSM